jgi:hypothetical protein
MRYIYKPIFEHLSTTDKILCVLYWKEGQYLLPKEIHRYVPHPNIASFMYPLRHKGWLKRLRFHDNNSKLYAYRLLTDNLPPRKLATILSTVREGVQSGTIPSIAPY